VRVAFDSRAQTDRRGIGRYVRCLLDALRETAGEHDEVVEAHRPRRADVFHSPWIDGALLWSPCPMVVTVHDLVPLKRRAEYLRTGVRFGLRYMAVQRAVRLIVPTQAVANDVVERLGIEPERVSVISEAPVAAMYPRPEEEIAAARERYDLPEQYLLWVGGLQHPDPRKRVAALAATSRHMPLVLVGHAQQWAHELPDVTLTGHVSDDDLAAIYSGAHALVFPSDDEGFGLPTVEALACGLPVVACDVPALREVLADRATFVERRDMRGLMDAAEAIQRPAPKPPDWSWNDAGRATWDVYRMAAAAAADRHAGRTRGPRRDDDGPAEPPSTEI
jgi:glycosyltransferase involved in cell wall biosynthesis